MKRHLIPFYISVIAFCACKKPYNPSVISLPNSYLVVEGIINSGSDSTIIKLSNTVKLNNKVTQNPVLGAMVTVESDQNEVYTLTDPGNTGNYGTAPLNLSQTKKYLLHIKTSNRSEYKSDFVAVKPTPPIDSIGYKIENGIINIYLNTHDATNNTRYYRWEYDETWQFHSEYSSLWVLNSAKDSIVKRRPDQMVYHCFGHNTSSVILLNSTAKLANDVVYQTPITQFSIHSERIETRYSILLKQYALTPGAYQFYQNIKTNSESLGSIFDAQPTQLIGNIHNVNNANEPVIGFVSVTNMQSKRVFFDNAIVPLYTTVDYPYDCTLDGAYYNDTSGKDVQNELINPPLTYIPIDAIYNKDVLAGFTMSTPFCVDCSLRGSTAVPSFWK